MNIPTDSQHCRAITAITKGQSDRRIVKKTIAQMWTPIQTLNISPAYVRPIIASLDGEEVRTGMGISETKLRMAKKIDAANMGKVIY